MRLHSNRGPNSRELGEEENNSAKNVHGRQWAGCREGASSERRDSFPAPTLVPCLPRKEVRVGDLAPVFGTRKGPTSQQLGMPSQLDKEISSVVESSLFGTGSLPGTLTQSLVPRVRKKRMFKAASFTSHLPLLTIPGMSSSSLTTVL